MRFLFLWLLVIIFPFRFFHIDEELKNITNFRQAQTATIALNYYKNGIDLLQSELDIFGKGKERYLTLEFPLYEALVALLYKIFFVNDLWGRLVSAVSGILGAWFLYKLVILQTKKRILGFFTSFFFLFAPLNMYHQRDFSIESTVVFFLLAGTYYFSHYVKYKDKESYLLAIFYLSFGFIQKVLYGPFWLLFLVWFYIRKNNLKCLLSIKFLCLVLIPLSAMIIWQYYVNFVNTLNGHGYFTSSGLLEWNFGLLSDRLSLSFWSFRLNNILSGIFLKPGIPLFLIGLIVAYKISGSIFFYIWLLWQIIYFLSLFRIQSHIYYQMVMIPAFSFFTACGILFLYKSFQLRTVKKMLLTLFCIFFIWRSFISSQWDRSFDASWYERIKKVGQSVPTNSWGIIVNPGGDWNSVYTYYSELKMKVVRPEDLNEYYLSQLIKDGYSYLVLHECRDYPDYFKIVKPGYSLNFLQKYKMVLQLEDFQVFLLL